MTPSCAQPRCLPPSVPFTKGSCVHPPRAYPPGTTLDPPKLSPIVLSCTRKSHSALCQPTDPAGLSLSPPPPPGPCAPLHPCSAGALQAGPTLCCCRCPDDGTAGCAGAGLPLRASSHLPGPPSPHTQSHRPGGGRRDGDTGAGVRTPSHPSRLHSQILPGTGGSCWGWGFSPPTSGSA